MSPARAALFKAQGGIRAKPEMKPWVHMDKSGMSSVGAALPTHALKFIRSVVPPLWGSINVLTIITQGLRPGLCRSIALKGSSTTRSKSMSVCVLVSISTCTYLSDYAHLLKCLRVLTLVSTSYSNRQVRALKFSTQLKSVQTSAVVCTNFSRSLYRLRRGFENRKHNFCFSLVCLGIFIC